MTEPTAGAPPDRPFTPRERAFIRHYPDTLNGAEAARRAGYSVRNAKQTAHELLARPAVRAAIADGLRNRQMQPEEARARLEEHARADVSAFLRIERVLRPVHAWRPVPTDDDPNAGRFEVVEHREELVQALDLEKAQAAGALHLVKKLKDGRDGLSVELHDAQAALVNLLKIDGKFVEKHEHTGTLGIVGIEIVPPGDGDN